MFQPPRALGGIISLHGLVQLHILTRQIALMGNIHQHDTGNLKGLHQILLTLCMHVNCLRIWLSRIVQP